MSCTRVGGMKCPESPSIFLSPPLLICSCFLQADKWNQSAQMLSSSLKRNQICCISYESSDSLKLFSFKRSLSFIYSFTLPNTWRGEIFLPRWNKAAQISYLYGDVLIGILLTQSFKCSLLSLSKTEKLSIFI